jgi:predicted HTH domain antitoxin
MSRKFIEEGLEQCMWEKAIELYVDEKGSLKDASEITGVTVRMTMRTLIKKNIPLIMDVGIFDRGMEYARRVFGS